MTRQQLLRLMFNAAAFALSLFLALFLAATTNAERDPIRLTHGPMLGKPTASSMSVWGRTSDAGQFTVRYGTDPKRLDQVSQPASTKIDHDNTGVARLTRLKSDTRYHYQVWVNDRPHGLPGSFQTLPSPDDTRNAEYNPDGLFNFRFQIGSCANQDPRHGVGHRAPTYENLNRDWAQKVHFHIMNGDWLYEELREHPAEAWRLTQGIEEYPLSVQVMPTVVGVWENYKLYLSRGVELAKWHRNVPSYFTFDDHELVNDIWGSSEAGKRHRRTVFRDIGTLRLVRLPRLGRSDGARSSSSLWPRIDEGRQRSARRFQHRFHQASTQGDAQPARPLGHAPSRCE